MCKNTIYDKGLQQEHVNECTCECEGTQNTGTADQEYKSRHQRQKAANQAPGWQNTAPQWFALLAAACVCSTLLLLLGECCDFRHLLTSGAHFAWSSVQTLANPSHLLHLSRSCNNGKRELRSHDVGAAAACKAANAN
jgi:hypothetical protein